MIKKLSALCLFFFLALSLIAQDTIKVMHYNLLYYGYYFGACNTTNNNVNDKNNYLKSIFNYRFPDIFTVNEIYCNSNVCQGLLDDALNEAGIDYYQRAEVSCHSPANFISNMLYYNAEKLGLADQKHVMTDVRDINLYKLYYKGNLQFNPDTVFLTCIVAHLKAGNDYEDEVERAQEVQLLMTYLTENEEPGNYLFMGDFNIYNSTEQAFQKMIKWNETAYRFHDPINEIGGWHNNASYASIHTQSTHTSSSGCPVTGGMDDRFDFILVSKDIRDGTKKIKYIPDTYEAIGQDGKHFNKAVNASPTNTSVPANVLNALYKNSDHLPVYCELFVGESAGFDEFTKATIDIEIYPNPASSEFEVLCSGFGINSGALFIYDVMGREIMIKDIPRGQTNIKITTKAWPAGLYLIHAKNQNSISRICKVLIK